MSNVISWFEIPVADLERARKFYSQILKSELTVQEMGPLKMAFFPAGETDVGGALCQGESYEPSTSGTLPYLNADPNLQVVLDRVEAAGGKVLLAKTEIGNNHGFVAFFIDSEGNRMGLHSNS